MSKWPAGTLERAIHLYMVEDKTQQEIAEILGVDRVAVVRNLKKHIPEDERKAKRHENWKKRSLQSNKTAYEKLRNDCVELFFSTEMTIQDIAKALGTTSTTVRASLLRSERMPKEELSEIIKQRSSAVRLYKMQQKPRKVEADNGRYNTSTAPEWLTKQYAHNSLGAHALVVCQHMGLTEIPEGYVVHHVNNDSKDNRFENLVLMTRAEHTALHIGFLKGVTTISKESTLKWVEARRNGATRSTLDDIVLSGQG